MIDKANEHFTAALQMDSTNYRLLNNLGNLNRKLNKIDQSIEFYKRSLRACPSK